jgi:hypothetical protein
LNKKAIAIIDVIEENLNRSEAVWLAQEIQDWLADKANV